MSKMSELHADIHRADWLVEQAAKGLEAPGWMGKRAPKELSPLGRRLLSAHVTIASSGRVLWWI